MARLTRTQKYADLRNQLENGRETEIKSDSLSKFENKMDDLNITPVHEVKVEEVIEDIKPVETVVTPELDDGFEELELDFEPVEILEETPVIEELPVAQEEPEVEEDLSLQTLNELSALLGKEEDDDEEEEETTVQEEVVEEVIEEVEEDDEDEDFSMINFDQLLGDVEVEEVVEEVQETVQEEVVEEVEEVVAPSIEETLETAALEVEEVEVINNHYLEECLNEVNEYNKQKGLMTADEVPVTILNEIRGNTTEVKIPSEVQVDDDFTNTVTLEIKKILSELALEEETTVQEEVVEESPVVQETVQEEVFEHPVQVQEEPVQEELSNDVADLLKTYLEPEQESVEDNLAQTMVVGNVADIKEEDTTLQATLLSDSIPLEVKKTEEVEEEEEEEEVEGPNRILNFILIALIFVLLCVLGFIGYLILVAEGII